MKCANCRDQIQDEAQMVLLNADGDFACDQLCKRDYQLQRERFLTTIVQSERLTQRWLTGEMA